MTYNPQHFGADEFQGWYLKIVEPWFVRADALRAQWGPIMVSQAEGAVGREKGSSSWHDYVTHGAVYAVDTFPLNIERPADAQHLLYLATMIGFTGIGFYPHWSRPGFHLDVRTDRNIGDPAVWGAIPEKNREGEYVGQQYVSFDRALNYFADQLDA